jgi:hypothetical protein
VSLADPAHFRPFTNGAGLRSQGPEVVVADNEAVDMGVGRVGAATGLVALVELAKGGTQLCGGGVVSNWRRGHG